MGFGSALRTYCDGKPGLPRISHMTKPEKPMKRLHFFLVILMALACAATVLSSDTLNGDQGSVSHIKVTQL